MLSILKQRGEIRRKQEGGREDSKGGFCELDPKTKQEIMKEER